MVADPMGAASARRSADPAEEGFPASAALHLTVIRQSLAWLAAANSVGVWLATLLVWPTLGRWVSPFTYGRWMPLHTEWQLYGWCSLPIAGLFFRWIPPPDQRHANVARGCFSLWSLALLAAGVSWLSGYASGKLFLTATGLFRFGLPSALVLLWACLAANLWHARHSLRPAPFVARGLLLVVLLLVPTLLAWASIPHVYPSVNPDSGGATGASLLGSTLVVVALLGLLPWALSIKPLRERSRQIWFAGYLFFSVAVFAVIDHGNVSHHQIASIAGLATLLGWVPLLGDYLKGFAWETGFRWRGALLSWWALLVVTGFVTFLPGVSETLKFTNALVAHAHIAMAGFASALCFIILETLAPPHVRDVIGQSVAFGLWQLGSVVYVLALLVLGWYESAEPGLLFSASPLPTLLYSVRLGAGVAMTTVSLWWFYRVLAAKSSK